MAGVVHLIDEGVTTGLEQTPRTVVPYLIVTTVVYVGSKPVAVRVKSEPPHPTGILPAKIDFTTVMVCV